MAFVFIAPVALAPLAGVAIFFLFAGALTNSAIQRKIRL
jgi:hypothetical protein